MQNQSLFFQIVFQECSCYCLSLHVQSSSIIARAIKLFQSGINSNYFWKQPIFVLKINTEYFGRNQMQKCFLQTNPLHAFGYPIPPNRLQRCIATINRSTDYCNNHEIIISDYWLSQKHQKIIGPDGLKK